MYHPTTRVLTVLELLQSYQRMSGRELAERLEVNTRTVRRYVVMLQDLGIPVESERGRHGAYVLRPGFKLPPLMFNDDEALALTLGLLAARRIGLAGTAPAVEGALAKIERVLPAVLRMRVQAVQEALALDFYRSDNPPASAVVGTLSEAASQGRRAWLRYRAERGGETEREVDPYGLVYREGRWYAVGYCHLRAGMRMFRLDRVLAVELREASFVRPPDFDSLDYVVRSLATMPGTWPIHVVLDTSLERAQLHVPPSLATLELTAEGVALRCHVESLDWMARFLVSLDCPFSVREPDELRETLRRLAAEIGELAEAGNEHCHASTVTKAG